MNSTSLKECVYPSWMYSSLDYACAAREPGTTRSPTRAFERGRKIEVQELVLADHIEVHSSRTSVFDVITYIHSRGVCIYVIVRLKDSGPTKHVTYTHVTTC